MISNKYDYEKEIKVAKRAEVKRIRLKQKATNKELLDAYKALNVAYKSLKKNKQPS